MIKKLLSVCLLTFVMSSCQRGTYDDDDYYSLVPLTNNPDLTKERNTPLPQMGY